MLNEINQTDILAEVEAVFERYNAALNANDVALQIRLQY